MDDFENALRKKYPQEPFNYHAPTETMVATINDYIQRNLEINIQQKTLKFNYKSLQVIEDNVCQVVYTGKYDDKGDNKTSSIKNTLLFDSFSKQSNILHLIIDEKTPKILQFFPAVPVRSISF